MSGNLEWTRSATLQLIDMIKRYPCLWQVRNKHYKNKTVRRASLNVMVKELMDTMKCVITPADIMKKLHTLRSQYRREMKEAKLAQKSGAGPDNLHVPKLWCFSALTFLYDGEALRDSTSNLDELVSQDFISDLSVEGLADSDVGDDAEEASDCHSNPQDDGTCTGPPLKKRKTPEGPRVSHGFKLLRGQADSDVGDEGEEASDCHSNPQDDGTCTEPPPKKRPRVSHGFKLLRSLADTQLPRKDRFHFFGQYIAEELRQLDEYSAAHVQKLFTDIILDARVGKFKLKDQSSIKPESPAQASVNSSPNGSLSAFRCDEPEVTGAMGDIYFTVFN